MDLGIKSERELNDGKNPHLKKNKLDHEFPDRYKGVSGLAKLSHKNHSNEISDLDQFSVAMKQDQRNKGMIGLHMTNASLIKGKGYGFPDTEGWIDPAQRRRAVDPNHAPVYDYNFGSDFQKYDNDADERVGHNNVDLIRQAHQSYQNHINRYNYKPGSLESKFASLQSIYTNPAHKMPNMVAAEQMKPSESFPATTTRR